MMKKWTGKPGVHDFLPLLIFVGYFPSGPERKEIP